MLNLPSTNLLSAFSPPGPNSYNDTLGLLKKWVNTGEPEDLIPLLALGDSRSSEFLTALDFLNAFLLHPLPIHTVKRVHALLLFNAVTPGAVTARAQIFLHRLADANILDLDLIAELD